MTCDRALFAGYPDRPHPPPKPSCCEALSAPPSVPARLWALVHRLGHSRNAITAAGLAAVAQVTDRQAQRALRAGEAQLWLHRVLPEVYETDPPCRWVGSLTQRR